MLGSPLLRALLAFLALAALGVPLEQITRPSAALAYPASGPSAEHRKAISLQLSFTTMPKKVVVQHLDREVWREPAPGAEMEREIALAYSEKGVELVFQIDWPEDVPLAAARVRLTDPTGATHEKNVWGRGAVEEVLSFP